MFKISSTVAIVATICISLIPGNRKPENYWEGENSYVYYTEERATFTREEAGEGYFYIQGLGEFKAYLEDSELVEGDKVFLLFENHETRQEYLFAEEYGIESVTKMDAGIVDIW